MSNFDVIHNLENQEFYIPLSDKSKNIKAVLQYSIQDKVYDLYHTEVPSKLRGQGIAKHLAKAALDYVVENKSQAILSCTYLQKYHKENPVEAHKNVVIG